MRRALLVLGHGALNAAVGVGLMLAYAVAFAAPLSEPLRPTAADVSLALPRSAHFKCHQGLMTTQAARDNLQHACWTWAVRAAREVRPIAKCARAVDQVIGRWLFSVTGKLGNAYEQRGIGNGGVWTVPIQGRHYQACHDALRDLQKCLTSGGSTQGVCAREVELGRISADVVTLLNLDTTAGKCKRRELTTKEREALECAHDSARGGAGALDTRHPPRPLTAEQRRLIDAVTACHDANSDARCGIGAGGCDVQGALLAFEATARDETERHFFQMKAFNGVYDQSWTVAERCQLAQIQKREFRCWRDHVVAGDWAAARGCDTAHWMAHLAANLKHHTMRVRPICPGHFNQNHCPALTVAQWMATVDAPDPGVTARPTPVATPTARRTATPTPRATPQPTTTACLCPCPCEGER